MISERLGALAVIHFDQTVGEAANLLGSGKFGLDPDEALGAARLVERSAHGQLARHGFTCLGQCGGGARGRDDQGDARRAELLFRTAQLAVDVLLEPGYVVFLGRVGAEELLLQADRAEGKAHQLAQPALVGEGYLATAAAEVDEKAARTRSGFMGYHSQVDQTALFEPGDDLDIPSGRRFDPRSKGGGIARVAHRAGGHHAGLVHHMQLHRFLKALEGPDGVRHGVG
jgi:hypothetical protein